MGKQAVEEPVIEELEPRIVLSVAFPSPFVSVSDGGFVADGLPLHPAGANSYYLMSYATKPSLRPKVDEVLGSAAALGLNFVRTWAFNDGSGPDVLQKAPGVFNENALRGLDYVLYKAGRLGLRVILPFVNYWADYGGMDQYVAWDAQYGTDGHTAAGRNEFYTDADTRQWFKNNISKLLNRVNTFTGRAYKNDPTIFAWELANEPRAEGDSSGAILQGWIDEMAPYVKSLDANHLLSTGEEGFYNQGSGDWLHDGCQGTDFIRNHQAAAIDFATTHVWTENWGVTDQAALGWAAEHVADARDVLGKPLIIEEFGKGRDAGGGTTARDQLYQGIMQAANTGGAGWGFWGLYHKGYQPYDDGNGVYYPADGSTAAVIRAGVVPDQHLFYVAGGAPLQFTDADGDAIWVTLAGAGKAAVILAGGPAGARSGDIVSMLLLETTPFSALTLRDINLAGGNTLAGGTITIPGTMGGVSFTPWRTGLVTGTVLSASQALGTLTVIGDMGAAGAYAAPEFHVAGSLRAGTVLGSVNAGVIEVGQLPVGGRITITKDLRGLLHVAGDMAKLSAVTIFGTVASLAADAILVGGNMAGTIRIVGVQAGGAGTNQIHIAGDMTGTVFAKQFGNAQIDGDWSGKWTATTAGAGTLQIYTRSTGVFSPANAFVVTRDALGYLARVEDQYHRTYDVYTDSNAAGNHFFARGRMFGDGLASDVPAMVEDWPDNRPADYSKPTDTGQFLDLDRAPGVDCIQASFHSDTSVNRLGNWGGWYFINGVLLPGETAPSENWGDCVNAGENLTGATRITFWARGERGGERVEFFALGVGRNPNTGLPQHTVGPNFRPDSSRKASTGYVTLTNQWKQYTINLRGRDLSYVLGGFGWVTNARNNGFRDITFYMDYIQYDKPSLGEPRFLVSYQTTEPVLRNAAFTYDNALALLTFLADGRTQRAGVIADALVYAVQNDRTYRAAAERVRNAYKAGEINLPAGWTPNGYAGTVAMPGCFDAAGGWQENAYQVSTSTGNVAWAMLGLLAYYDVRGGVQYLSTAELLGNWVQANCLGASGVGYTGGLVGPDGQQTAVSWKSTEHNIDLYAAFERLFLITGDAKWHDRASHAEALVEAMWTDPLGEAGPGHFWTGTLDDGVTPNTEVVPLDVQAWAVMALGGQGRRYWEALDWAEANLKVGAGYDYSLAPLKQAGVWSEGTAQMAAAFAWTGQADKAADLLSYLKSVQDTSGGLFATDVAALPTGFGDNYYHWLHVGATAWLLLARNTSPTSNPFWLGADTGWSVTAAGNQVQIAYGSGTSFPQYAALHTNDSYFRMNYGPTSGWGTSSVLAPALWTGGQYYQGTPVTATWRTAGVDLVLTLTGTIAGLGVSEEVWIAPPAQDLLRADVAMKVTGSVVLDNRPGEAFKVAVLSSMNEGPTRWDAQSAFVGGQTFAIPSSGWIVPSPVAGCVFGLTGGTSSWKVNAPTIRVGLYQDRMITGWVTASLDPNDDNVAFWAATDTVPVAWQYYTLTAGA